LATVHDRYKRKPEDDYAQHEPTITAEERQERIAMTDEVAHAALLVSTRGLLTRTWL
jgi:hypothetical protein